MRTLPRRGERQTMLWSATMPQWVHKTANRHMHSPEMVDLVGESSPVA